MPAFCARASRPEPCSVLRRTDRSGQHGPARVGGFLRAAVVYRRGDACARRSPVVSSAPAERNHHTPSRVSIKGGRSLRQHARRGGALATASSALAATARAEETRSRRSGGARPRIHRGTLRGASRVAYVGPRCGGQPVSFLEAVQTGVGVQPPPIRGADPARPRRPPLAGHGRVGSRHRPRGWISGSHAFCPNIPAPHRSHPDALPARPIARFD